MKFYLGFFITAFIALVSWIALHYRNFDDAVIFYGACTVAIILLIAIIIGTKHAKKILKEIRGLK
ncbi:hypothetical protein [Campylobacter mucosalis]|uniref:hypothetical protein n=1 Tax=Campylobacter mucosalis TaxID=202 RepID=UPI001551D5A4|nr:hypothetical protein [Campylobacter mucosalis]